MLIRKNLEFESFGTQYHGGSVVESAVCSICGEHIRILRHADEEEEILSGGCEHTVEES